jgi:hypothetical protein
MRRKRGCRRWKRWGRCRLLALSRLPTLTRRSRRASLCSPKQIRMVGARQLAFAWTPAELVPLQTTGTKSGHSSFSRNWRSTGLQRSFALFGGPRRFDSAAEAHPQHRRYVHPCPALPPADIPRRRNDAEHDERASGHHVETTGIRPRTFPRWVRCVAALPTPIGRVVGSHFSH